MGLTLVQAHAMVMIIAWMFFGSTGILFARYGRSLRLGNRRQLLGKAVWFQMHRFLLSITPLLTLLGFFLILVRAGGQWIDYQVADVRLFLHSIFGGIIICCTIVQIWLALYRCNPHSRFRYLFDWSHRITGLVAFSLSIPTIFLIIFVLSKSRTANIIITSIWSAWIVLITIILEKIEAKQRVVVTAAGTNGYGDSINQNNNNNSTNTRQDIESGSNLNVGNKHLYFIKLIIFLLHLIISTVLSISLITMICR